MLFYRFEHDPLWYWHWSTVPALNMCWSTIQRISAATAMSSGLFRWHRCYVGAIPFCRHATHEVFSAPLVAQGPFQHMDRAWFDEVSLHVCEEIHCGVCVCVCVSHCCSTLRGGILWSPQHVDDVTAFIAISNGYRDGQKNSVVCGTFKNYQELHFDLSHPLAHHKASLVEWCELWCLKHALSEIMHFLSERRYWIQKPLFSQEVCKYNGPKSPRYILYDSSILCIMWLHSVTLV